MIQDIKISRVTRAVIVVASTIALSSCGGSSLFEPHHVDNHQEAGSTNIAVTMVAPFEDYMQALRPEHDLKSPKALERVIPKTTLLDQKLLEVMSASFRAAAGEGVTAADLPEEQDPSGGRKASELEDNLPTDANKLEQDPILEYTAATFLLQEVELLNRYVTDAALRRDHVAYVVRLQLNVVPYARNQPYDMYATLGFFPARERDRHNELLILPLLVSDNLEQTTTSRVLNTVRQLYSALRLLQGSFVANLTFSSFSEKLESVLGSDHNSLLTVGRVTDNTMQVRIGARRQATAGYATVPFSNNITAVIMVPRAMAENAGTESGFVKVVLNTILRDAESGEALDSAKNSKRDQVTKRTIEKHLQGSIQKFTPSEIDWICSQDPFRARACSQDTIEQIVIGELQRAIFKNDFKGFEKILAALKWDQHNRLTISNSSLWLAIIETFGRDPNSAARFQLPRHYGPQLPRMNQAVLITDEPKKGTMSLELSGGKFLAGQHLSAELSFHDLNKQVDTVLPASKVEIDKDGLRVRIAFPSADKYGLKPVSEVLVVKFENTHKWNGLSKNQQRAYHYRNVYIKKSATAPSTPVTYKVAANSKVIRAQKGAGSVRLNFDLKKKSFQIAVTMEGGDLTKATLDNGTVLPILSGAVVVSSSGGVRFDVGNLDPAHRAMFKFKTKGNGNHKSLEFEVRG